MVVTVALKTLSSYLLRILLLCPFLLLCGNGSYAADNKPKKIVLATYGSRVLAKPYGPFAINKYLFEQLGYQVEFRPTPAKRMPYSLASGIIDGYPSSQLRRSIELRHMGNDGFLQVSYPETVTDIHVYYKKSSRWTPSWPPNEEFIRNARGVSLNYNYFSLAGFNILQIGDYQAGFKMVNFGRADFWVDGISSNEAFAALEKTESDGFAKMHLTHNPLFLTMRDEQREREIKTQWDVAFAELFAQPELFKAIYLENIPGGRSSSLGRYMQYIEDNYLNFQPSNAITQADVGR